jgi:hypothetical protein
MEKAYIMYLNAAQENDSWREDVSFDSHPENAMYWERQEDADIKCQELSRGVVIPSSEGGIHVLRDFRIEETEPGKYSIFSEGPFVRQ